MKTACIIFIISSIIYITLNTFQKINIHQKLDKILETIENER